MYPSPQTGPAPALAPLQARLRRAERQAAGGGLGAFTFLLRLCPGLFARSPGIRLAELSACAAAQEDTAERFERDHALRRDQGVAEQDTD